MSVLPHQVWCKQEQNPKAFLTWFKHNKCPEDASCAAIGTVTLRQHDNVIITCCVLQVTVGERIQWIKALSGDLPGACFFKWHMMITPLVFCSEINNQPNHMDGYALVVWFHFRGKEVRVQANSRWFVGPLWERAKMEWMHNSKPPF